MPDYSNSNPYPAPVPSSGNGNTNLPAIADHYRVSYPTNYSGSTVGFEPEREEGFIPLTHYLWVLRRHRWRVLSFVAAVVIATAIVSARLTPVYESTATIDVDRRQAANVVGQEMQTALNDSDQFLATQVRLIQSDSVLRPIVHKYNLIDYEAEGADVRPEAGVQAEDAPVLLKRLKVSRPPNTYLLLISYRDKDPKLAADVANAVAESYLSHSFNIRFQSSSNLASFMEKQLEELKAKMERSSAALAAFERELNVINPEEKTSILSARLLQLNQEYTNAQADRVRKQAAFDSVKSGSMEAALVSSQGDSLRRLTDEYNQAEQRMAAIRTQYGANHPEFKKAHTQLTQVARVVNSTKENIRERVHVEFAEALNREKMLERSVADTKSEFDRLNARSFEYRALKQEAENDRKLYDELLRKVKEAGINSSFQNSAIRLADAARPSIKPVFPNLKLNLLLAFLFSSIFAVGSAVLSDVLDNTIRDPEMVSRSLNTEVIGTLPLVKGWKKRLLPAAAAAGQNGSVALVHTASDDSQSGFDEAIRTLRNSILLSDPERHLRSLLVTSASPGEGKSTIAANIALAHAQQRHRTLLIDGDLRRPSVHRRFGIPNSAGLSDYLTQGLDWRGSVIPCDLAPDLHILTAGPASRSAADLIGRSLTEVLEHAAESYDLIILDAPPLLGFAEPLQMAAAVDGVVVVSKAGQTNRKAVSSVLSTLQRLRANTVGMVLNEVTKDLSDNYYYYGYYGRYYKYYKRPDSEETAGTSRNT
jgi:polysaccharide biosynthesis transport protein